MDRRTTKNGRREQGNSAVPDSRLGRVIWLTAAVIFLSAVAIVIWTWSHAKATPARGGAEVPAETTVGESDAVAGVALRAASDTAAAESPAESETAARRDELIYHGRRNDRMEIALSFDDGPHPYYTPLILEILAEYGIRATFFMVGENVGYYSEAAEAVAAAGHEIGNHTFSHRKFNSMSEHEMLREIAACEDAIASVSEAKPHFIRPPEGQFNDTMRRVIGTLDYRIVLWDVDTRDWAHTPPDTICTHILDTVQAGDIILMHDFIGHDSPTPEALRLVIPALLERGYHFVTVGELVDGDG